MKKPTELMPEKTSWVQPFIRTLKRNVLVDQLRKKGFNPKELQKLNPKEIKKIHKLAFPKEKNL